MKIESRDINVILTLNAVKAPALSEPKGKNLGIGLALPFSFFLSLAVDVIIHSPFTLSLSKGVFICLCEIVLPIGKDDAAISSCPWVRIGCGEVASSRFIGTKQRHIDLFIFEP